MTEKTRFRGVMTMLVVAIILTVISGYVWLSSNEPGISPLISLLCYVAALILFASEFVKQDERPRIDGVATQMRAARKSRVT